MQTSRYCGSPKPGALWGVMFHNGTWGRALWAERSSNVKVTDSHLPGQEMQSRIEVRALPRTGPQADRLLVRCGNSIGRGWTRQLGPVVRGSGSNYFDCGCRLLGAPAPYGKRPAPSVSGVSLTLPLASSSGSLVFPHLPLPIPEDIHVWESKISQDRAVRGNGDGSPDGCSAPTR